MTNRDNFLNITRRDFEAAADNLKGASTVKEYSMYLLNYEYCKYVYELILAQEGK